MSNKVSSLVWSNFNRGGSEKLAMLALADWCNDEGSSLYPSIAAISKKINVSESQARRIIHKFIDQGYLAVIANHDGGNPGQSRHYKLNVKMLETPSMDATPSTSATPGMDARDPWHPCALPLAPMTPYPSLSVNNCQYTDTDVSVVRNKKNVPDCPHQKIIDLYKNNFPEAIKPKHWTGERASALKTRWHEEPERQCLEWWGRFFEYIQGSDFLMGRVQALNRSPFKLRLDWIVKKENFYKIIEGFYENG